MDVQLLLSKQLVLGEMLARWARKQPDRECLIFKDKRFTYKQLDERVNRLANALADLGITKGDKVGLISMNSIEVIEVFFALAKLGAVAVPNNFRFKGPEHVYQLNQSDTMALVFSKMYEDLVSSIQPELAKIKHYICIGENALPNTLNYENLLKNSSPKPPNVYVDDDDPAFIMYTSGTTGKPKGVVVTHKNQFVRSMTFNFHEVKIKLRRYALLYPLFHLGATELFFVTFFRGSKIIILDDFTPENIMATIQKEKIDHLEMVSTLWNWVVNHPNIDNYNLSSIRMAGVSAAPSQGSLKERILGILPDIYIEDSFGMTETSGDGTSCTITKDSMEKIASVGLPSLNIEARLVDDNDIDVPVGQVGEIIYRGPSIIKEYYKQAEATREAFKGGWFHSGDLMQQGEDGHFYVVGRKKDMIISGGENIYPAEIEEVLYSHPKILEAAVIGVPDQEWGESVRAIIVLKQGEELKEDEVIKYCMERMASFKKPKSVQFVDAMPKSTTGKILKYVLRERANQDTTLC